MLLFAALLAMEGSAIPFQPVLCVEDDHLAATATSRRATTQLVAAIAARLQRRVVQVRACSGLAGIRPTWLVVISSFAAGPVTIVVQGHELAHRRTLNLSALARQERLVRMAQAVVETVRPAVDDMLGKLGLAGNVDEAGSFSALEAGPVDERVGLDPAVSPRDPPTTPSSKKRRPLSAKVSFAGALGARLGTQTGAAALSGGVRALIPLKMFSLGLGVETDWAPARRRNGLSARARVVQAHVFAAMNVSPLVGEFGVAVRQSRFIFESGHIPLRTVQTSRADLGLFFGAGVWPTGWRLAGHWRFGGVGRATLWWRPQHVRLLGQTALRQSLVEITIAPSVAFDWH